MFFFFGISPRTQRHGVVRQLCTAHGGESWHELTTQRTYFTLFFFLPIFPLGGRHDLLTCTECGSTWQLPRDEAARLAAHARTDVPVPSRPGFGGMFADVLRSWSPPPTQTHGGGPRRVHAERIDDPYAGRTHDPKQKVQWRPSRER